MRNGLLHDGLAYWARRTPDKLAAVLDDEDDITYGALARWSDGIAAHLQERGVIAGDRVGIAAANSIGWIASAVAVLKAGAIIAPFNDRLLGEELAYLAKYSEPRLIITDEPREQLLAGAGVAVPLLDIGALEIYRRGAPDGWQSVRSESTAIAMIIFTSGSTARPKGAMMALFMRSVRVQ